MKPMVIPILSLFSLLSLPLAVSADADLIIEQRQAAFARIEDGLDRIKRGFRSDTLDWQVIVPETAVLNVKGEALRHAFPQGTRDGSKARKSVWREREDFDRRLHDFNRRLNKLYQSALQGDRQSVAEALEQVEDTCRSCHRHYRSIWPW